MNTDEPARKTPPSPQIPGFLIRAIAVQAMADPGTVRRVLKGLSTKPASRERVIRAMATLGIDAAAVTQP